MRTLLLSLAISCLAVEAAMAADACKTPPACTEVQTCGSPDQCGRCGCGCKCEKRCQLVCTTKEVKKTVWVVHCTDFCAPVPSLCRKGECASEACCNDKCCAAEPTCCSDSDGKKCDPCAREESKCHLPPKCGKVREKKTLEKKEVVCKVPSYKCVVVYCCPHCGELENCNGESAPAPASKSSPPPAPAPAKTTQAAPVPPSPGAPFLN
jgi:hypothetical protein